MLSVQSIILVGLACGFSFGLAFALLRRRIGSTLTLSTGKTEVVTDLDAILSRTVGVRFSGRVYRIPPLSFEDFLKATNALAGLDLLAKEKVVSIEQIRQAYVSLFEICCPEILKSEKFSELTNQQMAALYKTILDQLVGKAEMESQKKSQQNADMSEKPRQSVS